jgi:hypothetical protein
MWSQNRADCSPGDFRLQSSTGNCRLVAVRRKPCLLRSILRAWVCWFPTLGRLGSRTVSWCYPSRFPIVSSSVTETVTVRLPADKCKGNGPPCLWEARRAVITIGGHRVPTLYRPPALACSTSPENKYPGGARGGERPRRAPATGKAHRERKDCGGSGRPRDNAPETRPGWEGALLGFCETRQCETA